MLFSYKMDFTFQNNPKALDPSNKMDLDLWDCFEPVRWIQNFGIILDRKTLILKKIHYANKAV